MTIRLIDRSRVRVALNPEDLEKLGLSQAELFFGGERAVAALLALLKEARESAGFTCAGRKLLIEAYPDGQGCVLYLQSLKCIVPGKRYRIRSERLAPHLFRFVRFEDLCAACRAVYTGMSHRLYRSTLYYDGSYLLSVCVLDNPRSPALGLLREFAAWSGKGRLSESILAEHARLLRAGDAIDALAGLGR